MTFFTISAFAFYYINPGQFEDGTYIFFTPNEIITTILTLACYNCLLLLLPKNKECNEDDFSDFEWICIPAGPMILS